MQGLDMLLKPEVDFRNCSRRRRPSSQAASRHSWRTRLGSGMASRLPIVGRGNGLVPFGLSAERRIACSSIRSHASVILTGTTGTYSDTAAASLAARISSTRVSLRSASASRWTKRRSQGYCSKLNLIPATSPVGGSMRCRKSATCRATPDAAGVPLRTQSTIGSRQRSLGPSAIRV